MSNRPNVVFMLGDNVGAGDLSAFGGLTPTPRLDRLAAEGVRFTNFNTEAQCTPTRGALLTGRMPVRTGTYTVPLPGSPLPYGLSPWTKEPDWSPAPNRVQLVIAKSAPG